MLVEILLLILVALVFYRTFPRFTTFAFLAVIMFLWLHDLSFDDLKVPLAFAALGACCMAYYMLGGILMDKVFQRKPALSAFFNRGHYDLHPRYPVSRYSTVGQVLYTLLAVISFLVLICVIAAITFML